MESLWAVFKSCTFDEVCQNLRDKLEEKKEEATFDKLKKKVEKFWRHQLELDEAL